MAAASSAPGRRPPRRALRIGLGAAVLAAGAAISGAAALLDGSGDAATVGTIPDPIWTVAPAAEVLPGAPVVTLLGSRESEVVEGSAALELAVAPPEATHVRIAVTCLTAGHVGWGFDPANTPSMACSDADVPTTAWEDVALSRSRVLHVLADAGVTTRIEYEYATHEATDWGVNAADETYGVSNGSGEPDLVAVIGQDDAGNDVEGYARRSELDHAGLPQPRDPEEAVASMEQLAELAAQHPDGLPVPVYESDGVTRIGTFFVGV